MAGLLGDGWDDPRSAAIMALSGGLLKGDFGGGLLGANQAYGDARRGRTQAQLQQMQLEQHQLALEKAKREAANEQGLLGLQSQFFKPGSPGMGGTGAVNSALPPDMQIGAQTAIPPTAPQFDVKGFTAAALQNKFMTPLDAIKLQQAMAKDTQINKLDAKDFTPQSVAKFSQSGNYADLVRMDKLHFADAGGRVAGLNSFTGQEVGGVPKTGNPFSDLVLSDGQGGVRPNSPLISAKSQVARSGASNTNISVNTEKSLLNEVAGGFGKSLVEGKAGAQAALSTISTVNRLMDALDSGQVMAGPGTTFRQFGLQIGNMLGVAGQNGQEKLVNTRQAIQSLAQLELDAAQQMKGQGQITEAERAIIRRAASGDIGGMTTKELRLLGGILDRTARTKIRGYNQQVKPLASNPNAAPIAPFLNVEEPTPRQQSNVLRFDAQGNPVR